ncbi:MAG: hypothetical protein ACI9DC_000109 [Gammaproteobacteria bacterium]|jgi:hypothetical protein
MVRLAKADTRAPVAPVGVVMHATGLLARECGEVRPDQVLPEGRRLRRSTRVEARRAALRV